MRRLLTIASLVLLTGAGMAQTKVRTTARPLSDAAMDRVTAAGGITTGATNGVTAGLSNGVVNFQGSVPTKNGLVSASGSLTTLSSPVTNNTVTTNNTGTINLSGQAQQGMTSLVSINAINSQINVLLNLNVNINSTVGTLTQSNLTGKH